MTKTLNKRRVMLVTMNGDSSTTGFAVRVVMMAKTLADAGYEVVLLRLYPALRSQGSWRGNLFDGIELIEIPIPPTARFRLLRKASFVIASLIVRLLAKIKSIDVIQAEAHEAGLAVLKKKPANVLVIVDFHGAAPEESPTRKKNSKDHWLDIAEVTCLKKADAVLVVSPRMIDHLETKYPQQRMPMFFLVPVNVEETFFRHHCKISARKRLGLSKDDLVYVYSGGSQSYQCISEMAALFRLLRKRNPLARLLIISTQLSDFKKSLEAFCPEYNHEIIFTSASKADMPALLAAGDMGFLLRKKNILNDVSCPTKFGEYLACGLGAITTPWAGHAPHIVQEHNVGIVIDFDTEKSVDIIEKFNTRLSDDFSKYCSLLAKKNMHWATSAGTLLKCHDLLQTPRTVLKTSSGALS